MSNWHRMIVGFVIILAGGLSSASLGATDNGGRLKLGYLYIDDEGNRSRDQATYNLYEGVSLSLEEWFYRHENGVVVLADLRDISLNNRNLRLNVRKPGLVQMDLRHHQYRRIYDFYGGDFTRRRSTDGQLSIQPHRQVRLYGGWGVTEKYGDNLLVFSPSIGGDGSSTNYSHSRINLGALIQWSQGMLKSEYRHFGVDDKSAARIDRHADQFTLSASSVVPRHKWITLAGGYQYRRDQADDHLFKLFTHQLWGATKAHLPHEFTADYRLLFARTEHTGNGVETDNWVNTVGLGKRWAHHGGIRVGYENRIADDLVDRTESHGFLFSGWVRLERRLHGRFQMATRSREVKTGSTLVGDEDYTRHRVSLKFSEPGRGSLAVAWFGRLQKNDDINSAVDYDAVTAQAAAEAKQLGRLAVTYSYYLGSFENRSDRTGFEFEDHVLTGRAEPMAYRGLALQFGATYYRSKRDKDIEKFSLAFGAEYAFHEDYRLGVEYDVFNYDDYLKTGSYYTSNVVEVSLIRDIKL